MIQGMTLRDWFAGQALASMAFYIEVGGTFPSDMAEQAYMYADDMIEERGEEPDNILHSKIRDKLARQIKELKELKNQTNL
jgi:hypothetical protein